MSNKCPVHNVSRDSRSFLAPSKRDLNEAIKSPIVKMPPNKKYAHIQSKVSTFWTPRERERVGVKQFFARKGTSSASTSASSSMTNSPDSRLNRTLDLGRRSLPHQISGPDFAARLAELKMGIPSINESPPTSPVRSPENNN